MRTFMLFVLVMMVPVSGIMGYAWAKAEDAKHPIVFHAIRVDPAEQAAMVLTCPPTKRSLEEYYRVCRARERSIK